MKASLIIAAGGSGTRFQKSLNVSTRKQPSKLFVTLAGKTLLERTVELFQSLPQVEETLIAVPKEAEKTIQAWIQKKRWRNVRTVLGGGTRSESVYNALLRTNPKNALVAVHDGARPFAPREALRRLFQAAGRRDAVLLGQRVIPTIKEVGSGGMVLRTVDRTVLCEAQTPQVAKRKLLLKAYQNNRNAFQATDESSLLESIGVKVHLLTHEGWNPKITTYKDFELAECYLNKIADSRTGIGRDTHRLVEGRKLILGGIHIPFTKGPMGHSDGDALLHAITDALLGAASAGDIGDWFSDKNPKFKNIASGKILKTIMDEVILPKFHIVHIDTVVILEEPKLGKYKKLMKENIARILQLPSESVSIKAKTAEGLGSEGQGLAVTCEAIVTMKGIH